MIITDFEYNVTWNVYTGTDLLLYIEAAGFVYADDSSLESSIFSFQKYVYAPFSETSIVFNNSVLKEFICDYYTEKGILEEICTENYTENLSMEVGEFFHLLFEFVKTKWDSVIGPGFQYSLYTVSENVVPDVFKRKYPDIVGDENVLSVTFKITQDIYIEALADLCNKVGIVIGIAI